MDEHGPAEARQFYRKPSRTLLKETDTPAAPRLRGSSVCTALHGIICGKLLPVDLEWGVGGGYLCPFFMEPMEEMLAPESCSRECRLGCCFRKASSPFVLGGGRMSR